MWKAYLDMTAFAGQTAVPRFLVMFTSLGSVHGVVPLRSAILIGGLFVETRSELDWLGRCLWCARADEMLALTRVCAPSIEVCLAAYSIPDPAWEVPSTCTCI